MNWKTDSNLLSKKILERIQATDGEITYSELEKIATTKKIDINIFDAAMAQLHRHKKVTQRVKGDDIYYKAIPLPVKKSRFAASEWIRDNYPQPSPWCVDKYGAFIMAFPEIDMSWIILRPEELLEYRAKAKGIPLHMMKHIHGKQV